VPAFAARVVRLGRGSVGQRGAPRAGASCSPSPHVRNVVRQVLVTHDETTGLHECDAPMGAAVLASIALAMMLAARRR
jgi:hypothetical protein